jgi:hypothetical protein
VLAASFKEREVALKAARLMESGAIDDYLERRERDGEVSGDEASRDGRE